jgi:hypothetical protein
MEERPIAFGLLQKDELQHEVVIRFATPASTVADLRPQVKKLSKEIPTDEIVSFDGDVTEELSCVKNKILKLRELLQPTEKQGSLKVMNRAQALAHHLFHRLTRLSPTGAEAEIHIQLSDELAKLISKIDNIFTIFRSSLSTGTVMPSNVEPLPTPITKCSTDTHNAVAKLNLQFNGNTCVKTFLRRLDQLRASRDISEDRLFSSASELFTGDALLWFEGFGQNVKSWAELRALLIRDYLPIDYNERLLNEIRSRTQGVDENIVAYLSVMLCYFSRLERPLPVEEQLGILLHNIRPFYSKQLALTNIGNIDELRTCCRQLEAASQRAKLFAEPSKDVNKSLAADLVFKGNQTRSVAVIQTGSDPDFCVRCRVHGHKLSVCKAPRKIICYRCGEKDVTAKTCTKCNQSKN